MARVLVVFYSRYGQTGKIAEFISDELAQQAHRVDIFDLNDEGKKELSVKDYDAVIVGAPVYLHRFPRKIVSWVYKNAVELAGVQSSFFAVCLGVLEQTAAVQEDERNIVQKFFSTTGWFPSQWTIFAGALKYTSYNWFLKRLMRNIARRAGGDTDLTHDFEYTDWQKVRKFISVAVP
jgi:menaquinone-dependent protoporphyrinogen oxidase